jgi:glyoxylase-like metal-dependent hydrolase (beta-lactamase superfamily II)
MLNVLPPQVHVFVRDWLSANNVLLRSRDGHVLIDSGYVTHAPLTLALLASPRGLAGDPLALLVNTHCHSDHFGGNAAVQRAYGCPIALPAGEVAPVETWDTTALLLDYADQSAERFHVDEGLPPGTTRVWGDLEWQVLAAPGHAMRAVVFFNPEHGILISGDALWANGYGFVMPAAFDPQALPAARATLDMLAALPIRVVIPGHGEVFTDVAAALDRAYRRTAAFEADETRLARYALKALLAFTLLHRRRMALADLPAYVERVGIFRDFNARCLQMAPAALAALLVAELERAGAVRRDGEHLVPAGTAAG